MDIADFTFTTRQLDGFHFETMLTHKDGNKFGCIYQSQRVIPNEHIFSHLQQKPQEFFIEVESTYVPEPQLITTV